MYSRYNNPLSTIEIIASEKSNYLFPVEYKLPVYFIIILALSIS